LESTASEPAFEVAAVDDAEDEEDAVVGDEVVHDSVVADAESAEGVCVAADCLCLLAADAASSGCCGGELFEVGTDALPQRACRSRKFERHLVAACGWYAVVTRAIRAGSTGGCVLDVCCLRCGCRKLGCAVNQAGRMGFASER
jgi:hypothetical protein